MARIVSITRLSDKVTQMRFYFPTSPGVPELANDWARLAPNGTNIIIQIIIFIVIIIIMVIIIILTNLGLF